MKIVVSIFFFIGVFWGSLSFASTHNSIDKEQLAIDLGEKLFLEERFSKSFADLGLSSVNEPTLESDKSLEWLSPFFKEQSGGGLGQHFSCSACHLVDQGTSVNPTLVLAYNDFFSRSPVPDANLGIRRTTVRNSMNMVLSTLSPNQPLHWDGEFFSGKDLACSSLVGDNMGWSPQLKAEAEQHILNVLRHDDGRYPSLSDLENSYTTLFSKMGTDLHTSSDAAVLDSTCEFIASYMADIDFSRNEQAEFDGSGYDAFLQANGLPRKPNVGEAPRKYARRLAKKLESVENWNWVEPTDLDYHQTSKKFGPLEFQGLRVFLGRGQCVQCHTPPNFTDLGFHNVGISQLEYDSVHGSGSFGGLTIPSLEARATKESLYLPASVTHPDWQGVFREVPVLQEPRYADLGAWGIVANPDKLKVQGPLRKALCNSEVDSEPCGEKSISEILEISVARFKTPTLRSLGQTGPYFHNGKAYSLLDVLTTYLATSRMARKGRVRNGDSRLKSMRIAPGDFLAIESFLNALNEDYD